MKRRARRAGCTTTTTTSSKKTKTSPHTAPKARPRRIFRRCKWTVEAIEEYFTGQRQKTNRWGEKTGEEQPLADHIAKAEKFVAKMLSQSLKKIGEASS